MSQPTTNTQQKFVVANTMVNPFANPSAPPATTVPEPTYAPAHTEVERDNIPPSYVKETVQPPHYLEDGVGNRYEGGQRWGILNRYLGWWIFLIITIAAIAGIVAGVVIKHGGPGVGS